jgi:hypothetical protein
MNGLLRATNLVFECFFEFHLEELLLTLFLFCLVKNILTYPDM